jgi:nicotinate-nucleotide adenylyltransferase
MGAGEISRPSCFWPCHPDSLMLDFSRRAAAFPSRLGIFPGTFNPITVAHLALARAALNTVGEVLFVLPRIFPHKEYSGANFEERVELLQTALADESRFSLAGTDAGLFIDIAQECRNAYGPQVHLTFLCGRDAAERIAGWDYGRPGAWPEMLREFDLLVAARAGEFRPPVGELGSFHHISLDSGCDAVSASEVRRRIEQGEPWEHLVPDVIRTRVREIYTQKSAGSSPSY